MQFGTATCAAVLLALATIVYTEDIANDGADLETVDDANPYADSRKSKKCVGKIDIQSINISCVCLKSSAAVVLLLATG